MPVGRSGCQRPPPYFFSVQPHRAGEPRRGWSRQPGQLAAFLKKVSYWPEAPATACVRVSSWASAEVERAQSGWRAARAGRQFPVVFEVFASVWLTSSCAPTSERQRWFRTPARVPVFLRRTRFLPGIAARAPVAVNPAGPSEPKRRAALTTSGPPAEERRDVTVPSSGFLRSKLPSPSRGARIR